MSKKPPRKEDFEPSEDDLSQIADALEPFGSFNNYDAVKVALGNKKRGIVAGGNNHRAGVRTTATGGYTNPQRLKVMLRRAKALELRRAGFTYEEIAARPELPYKGNTGRVAADMRELLNQVIEVPAKDVLGIELSRLDAMTQTLWKKCREGDLPSIDRLLRVMRHRQDLLGLAAPVRHEVVTKDHMDKEVERLLNEFNRMSEGTNFSEEDLNNDDLLGVPAAESFAATKEANSEGGTRGVQGKTPNGKTQRPEDKPITMRSANGKRQM